MIKTNVIKRERERVAWWDWWMADEEGLINECTTLIWEKSRVLYLLCISCHFFHTFSAHFLLSFYGHFLLSVSLSLPLPSPFRDCQKLAWPCLSLCISFSLVLSLTLSCCKTGARFFSPFLKGFCFYFSVFIVPIHFRKRQPILWFMPWNFLWCFFKLFFRKHNFKVITVIFIIARTATIILLYIFNPYYYCTVFPG